MQVVKKTCIAGAYKRALKTGSTHEAAVQQVAATMVNHDVATVAAVIAEQPAGWLEHDEAEEAAHA